MSGILVDTIGWIGALLAVSSYALVSYKKLEATGTLFQMMNLLGAIGIGINAFVHHAGPSLGVQFVWGSIAIIALIRNTRK